MDNTRITNANVVTSHGNVAARRAVVEIIEAGLRAADPYSGVLRLVRVVGDRLEFGAPDLEAPGDPRSGANAPFDLPGGGRIFVFGAGKGVQRVARALEDLLGDRLTGGHVIAKHEDEQLCARIGVTYGAHPVPDAGCAEGCERILALAAGLTERDLVFTIGASGISSLLTLPAAGVSLEEVCALTYLMQIEHGVPTTDLNKVRNHIDRLKGGKITRYFRPARVVHLVAKETASYSRLAGGRHFVHFYPDTSTFADAIEVLHRWRVWDVVPASIRQHLSTADPREETVKPSEFEAMNGRIYSLLSVSEGMLPSAERRARELGFTPHRLATSIQAEASQAGLMTADIALSVARDGMPFTAPCALISGGELLVTVGKETGIGGRNQEFALAAALRLAGDRRVAVGAVDSDGTDGPGGQFHASGATIPCLAGGVVDGTTARAAELAGVDIQDVLRRHDTTPALWQLGDAILATHSVSLLDLRVALVTA